MSDLIERVARAIHDAGRAIGDTPTFPDVMARAAVRIVVAECAKVVVQDAATDVWDQWGAETSKIYDRIRALAPPIAGKDTP